MRRWLVLVPTLGLLGCSGGGGYGGGTDTTTATTAIRAIDVCVRAQETVGDLDPPTDLVEVAAMAGLVADLATAPDEPLHSALAAVSDAAALLTDAARSGDTATVADAAATLTGAYDALDEVAADLGRAECTSESWGRQVSVAAIDLVGAGG